MPNIRPTKLQTARTAAPKLATKTQTTGQTSAAPIPIKDSYTPSTGETTKEVSFQDIQRQMRQNKLDTRKEMRKIQAEGRERLYAKMRETNRKKMAEIQAKEAKEQAADDKVYNNRPALRKLSDTLVRRGLIKRGQDPTTVDNVMRNDYLRSVKK